MITNMRMRWANSVWHRVLLVCGLVASVLVPGGCATTATPTENVQKAMTLLKAKAAQLGPAQLSGEDSVGGKTAPALFFGSTRMNNNFALVDEVQQAMGGTATFFVRSGDDFVRVTTNVKRDDGSRAIGTVLDPKGKAIGAIRNGEAYYGEADILGKAYVTGYEPIRDGNSSVIGIYYVGYLKGNP
jgi:hypothetical protein